MFEEDSIPGELRHAVKCPRCTAELTIEQNGYDPEADDLVSCYFHGQIGTRQDVLQAVQRGELEMREKVADVSSIAGQETYNGQATYYNLPGSSTASGAPFDPNAMAGAMTAEKVPLGSNVTVTYTNGHRE